MSENSILLHDPFKNLLDVYRMILEGERYLVETALNLEEAFRLLSLKKYSLFITEYVPPLEDTYRVIEWLKANSPETYIIMVTNTSIEEKSYQKLFDLGLDDLILKPYSPEKILVHIKKGLRQRDFMLRQQTVARQSFLDPISYEIEQVIFNPVYFRKCLRQELKKARRYRHPLSLLFCQFHLRKRWGIDLIVSA